MGKSSPECVRSLKKVFGTRAPILALSLMLLLSARAAGAQVVMLMSEWPPFEYLSDGVPTGVDVEILVAVFDKMGVPLRIEVYPWARAEKMAKEGQCDGLFTMSRQPDREAYAIFPSEAIDESENVIFVLRGSPVKFGGYEDLAGLSIGVTAGYHYGQDFDGSRVFTREVGRDDTENMRKLAAGRVDAFVCDRKVGLYLLGKLGLGDRIVALPKVVSSLKMYAAFVRKPGAEKLAAGFDAALAALKASGRYGEIIDRYRK